MRRTTTPIGLLAAGLLLTACSSSSNGGRPDDTATPPATTATAKAAPKRTSPAAKHTTAPTKAAAPGPASCKAAIKAQYEPGTARLTGSPARPPQCAGLSSDEVSQIVLDVTSANTGG
jgi:hypothetical protein